MKASSLLTDLLNIKEPSFYYLSDSESLNIIADPEIYASCEIGDGNNIDLALHQFVALQMLVEQGIAEEIKDGFAIPSEQAVRLDSTTRQLLQLPPTWPGTFDIRIQNFTPSTSFTVRIQLITSGAQEIAYYELKGPLLKLAEEELYLPTPEQWEALKAVQDHQNLEEFEKTEYQNLRVIHRLRLASDAGCELQLHHFEGTTTLDPEAVRVSGRIEEETGDLILTPIFEGLSDTQKIEKRLHRLDGSGEVQSLRVEDTFVLLDEGKLEAVNEIITNRRIPKDQVQTFLKSPTLYLQSKFIDLDHGFSCRVAGATYFQHAYFGESDASEIGWFDRASEEGSLPEVFEKIKDTIDDLEELDELQSVIEDAWDTGATAVQFNGQDIDISDKETLEKAIVDLRAKLQSTKIDDQEAEVSEGEEQPQTQTDKAPQDPIVLDAALNDEELEFGSEFSQELIQEVSFKGPLDFDHYIRTPMPHQIDGIRWILGLASRSLEPSYQEEDINLGGLLADDMGLGKTYMSVAAIDLYYKRCEEVGETKRPVLVVAPVGLLLNWKDEVYKTFNNPCFKDVVVLQADAELSKYRSVKKGVEIHQNGSELNTTAEDNKNEEKDSGIRYYLKIGDDYPLDRLDVPERLVLTTYQTLRDYQFSLGSIDWSFVVFDEAQNIKNPNTLATRAAKGIKAKFKLMVTGTPVENHLGDFWCLVDTACPGLLGSYQDFRKTYISPIRASKKVEITATRLKIGKLLRERVGAYMLRRLKEDNLEGLPQKTIFVGDDSQTEEHSELNYLPILDSTMIGEQLERYDTAISTTIHQQESAVKGNYVLAGLHQLRDITLHPYLRNSGQIESPSSRRGTMEQVHRSGKLKSIISILDGIKERDEKVIIFLINKRLQAFLKVALQRIYDIRVNIINGDTKAVTKHKDKAEKSRRGIIASFEGKPGFGILIMSPVAAGTGLTIVSANNVIHLERHWNPAKEDQATDRVYRIGQTKDVSVYLPILKHPQLRSFDENLHRLLSNKISLKDAVVTPEEVSPDDIISRSFGHDSSQANLSRRVMSIDDVDDLSWSEFEAFCAELFKQYYNESAYLTPANDDGVDVVLMGKDCILIQCKHTNAKKRYDSKDALREIYSSRPSYEKKLNKPISKFLVASNASGYSRRIKRSAEDFGVELISRKEIAKILQSCPIDVFQIQRRLQSPRLFEN